MVTWKFVKIIFQDFISKSYINALSYVTYFLFTPDFWVN